MSTDTDEHIISIIIATFNYQLSTLFWCKQHNQPSIIATTKNTIANIRHEPAALDAIADLPFHTLSPQKYYCIIVSCIMHLSTIATVSIADTKSASTHDGSHRRHRIVDTTTKKMVSDKAKKTTPSICRCRKYHPSAICHSDNTMPPSIYIPHDDRKSMMQQYQQRNSNNETATMNRPTICQ